MFFRYFATATALVVLAFSCKEVPEPDVIEPANPGDEVVFGAELQKQRLYMVKRLQAVSLSIG